MKASELDRILPPAKRKTPASLARFLSNRNGQQSSNFSLLLGAGASRSSGIATGQELVKQWLQAAVAELGFVQSEKATPDEHVEFLKGQTWFDATKQYSSLFEYHYPIHSQRRNFIEKQVENKQPSIGYAYLVRLTEAHFIRTIFTTNFDDLINEAHYQFSNERPIVCAHDSSINNISITSSRTKIIKLHGDYLFENIRSSNSDTQKLDQNTKEKLNEFLREFGLIVLGYSGGDDSVMDCLNYALSESGHLKHGLHWCLRAEDEVNETLLKLLRKEGAFYCIINGFDCLLADLYAQLCGDKLPFNSKIASARASKVIESYLNNPELQKSNSETIRKHLLYLEEEKHSSSLSDAINALHCEAASKEKITDNELLFYIETERLINKRKYEEALNQIQSELKKTHEKKFLRILLDRQFYCCKMMYRLNDALRAAEALAEIEPNNTYITINKCKVTQDQQRKIQLLNNAVEQTPYLTPLLNLLCEETVVCYETKDSKTPNPTYEDVVRLHKKSIRTDPSIRNEAWRALFDFISEHHSSTEEKNTLLEEIIDEHISQNQYSYRTVRLVYEYCQINGELTYKKRGLFEYIDDGFNRHFPKNYPAHFRVYSSACLEFGFHDPLVRLLDKCFEIPELTTDDEFISDIMDLSVDFYRDLETAARLGEGYLKRNSSPLIEESLLNVYIAQKNHEKASLLLPKMKGVITEKSFILKAASILELQGKYQDAIDKIRSLGNEPDFLEKHTGSISYLYLKMGEWDKARSECKRLLDKHSFNSNLEGELINYEFARSKSEKKPHLKNIKPLSEKKVSSNIKGVAQSLIGDHDAAFETLKQQAEKRYSNLISFLSWPALEPLHNRLEELDEHLLRTRRTIDSNKLLKHFHFIEI